MEHTERGFPKLTLVVAAGLAGGALLWATMAVPALVKYPTDLDITTHYEGTFTVFVDPASAAPLADPIDLPLSIDRHIRAVPEESGSSTVVVEEVIVQRAGELVDATQTNVYVMDRSTLENVADDRAYAFTPDNVVDRSGSYRLNLPFHTSQEETYAIYQNEFAGTYEMRSDTVTPTVEEHGLQLSNFVAAVQDAPLSPAYQEELNRLVPLPDALTLDQLKPQLLAAGIDVDALTGALVPVLSVEDLSTLGAIAGEPVPLEYVLAFEGRAAVEPVTGAEVHVTVNESVGAHPRLTNLDGLLDLLARYPEVPAATAAADALAQLAEAPATTLFAYSYDQTPASVAEVADEAGSMREQVLLAERYVPGGLLVVAALVLAGGFVVMVMRRRRGEAVIDLTTTTPEPPAGREARELVQSGHR